MAYAIDVPGPRAAALAATMMLLGGCDDAPAATPAPKVETPPRAPEVESAQVDAPPAAPQDPFPNESPEVDTPSPSAPAATPAQDDAAPIELRRAGKAMMLYDAPDFGAAFRGKIARGETFAVFESAQGDEECRGDWARVGTTAYACLHRSEVVEAPAPRTLPVLGGNGLTPYYYAKRRSKDHPAPIWRSRAALRRGDDPIGELEMDHDYAFVTRKRSRQGRLLSDSTRRTVKEADVRRLRPSEFEGRDIATDPLPSEGMLAWAVAWPQTPRYEQADPKAALADPIEFQTTVIVDDAPVRKRGTNFYPLHDGSGWVDAKQVRRYLPTDAPEDIEENELWLDAELTQQTLAVMRGKEPLFITLVSSGTGKHPTPPGLYRIISKQAVGDMRSRPSDADDPYHVEAVPWVMYFEGRFALHGAFWHNRFGNRVSHGCINLAPKDAARVFGSIDPPLPGGWMTVYEHDEQRGTLVRVRKADKDVPDRRRDPRRRTAKD